MFKKENQGGESKEVETVIGPSVKVKGNFHGKGNIIVEGILEGSLKTAGNIFVGENAKITANIETNDIEIAGEINGNIKAEGYLEIKSTAIITGDVDCKTVSIEKGAQINGKYSMSKNLESENKNTEE